MVKGQKAWSKVGLVAVAIASSFLFSACGKDSGQNSVTANTPSDQQNCVRDAYGNCNWNAFPTGWQQGSYGPDGSFQCQDQGRPGRHVRPIRREGFGPACAPMDQPAMYWSDGNTVPMCNAVAPQRPGYFPNPCPEFTYCEGISHSFRQNDWDNSPYAAWGYCRYRRQ